MCDGFCYNFAAFHAHQRTEGHREKEREGERQRDREGKFCLTRFMRTYAHLWSFYVCICSPMFIFYSYLLTYVYMISSTVFNPLTTDIEQHLRLVPGGLHGTSAVDSRSARFGEATF